MYRFEQSLVDDFIEQLPSSPFNAGDDILFSTEFNYSRGKTDIVILSPENTVIAIEAKLSRWREALQQAYRNTCFAHFSYVLLPEEIAKIAETHPTEFLKRSVGLCYISEGEIKIAYEAKENLPLQPWLLDIAIKYIIGEGNERSSGF